MVFPVRAGRTPEGEPCRVRIQSNMSCLCYEGVVYAHEEARQAGRPSVLPTTTSVTALRLTKGIEALLFTVMQAVVLKIYSQSWD